MMQLVLNKSTNAYEMTAFLLIFVDFISTHMGRVCPHMWKKGTIPKDQTLDRWLRDKVGNFGKLCNVVVHASAFLHPWGIELHPPPSFL